MTAGIAAAFETILAGAPEQWWGAFHPYWPELATGPPRMRHHRPTGARAMAIDPLVRRGRADVHIHTMASDGTSSVAEILDLVERDGVLDVIGIADHERIDAALAARAMAVDRGSTFEVVVGQEISTLGGHLVGLFLEQAVPAMRSLRWSIEAVHDQGGLAIVAHPLVPYPLCAQGFVLRRLLDDDDPAVHPDTIETFNPTAFGRYGHRAAVALRCRARPVRVRRQRCPRGRRGRVGLDLLPRPLCGGPAAGDRARHVASSRAVPRLDRPARRVRASAPEVLS